MAEREQIYRITNSGKVIPVGELVMCKDCRNKECEGRNGKIVCDLDGEAHTKEWFCADGERQEGE